ncbi:hypothetical protein SacmaDRAFT_1066 [Saccharomonospora marina XMU15]|uniref:DUF559 domain-containing protein n=2 Tax=Saccharomonospora TaxID=1851 RepID=H5XBC0_9PSEU|nr:hypothetical protein SacmaDRAFT_1066 [Saccharomonospora marina XMU15]
MCQFSTKLSTASQLPLPEPRSHDHAVGMTFTIDAAKAAQHPVNNIVSVSTLRARGVLDQTIARRCRPGGPWRRLAPGVVMLASGEPTRTQLLHAAATYLGKECVLTGHDALCAQGLDLPKPRTVHALVPNWRRLSPPEFLLLERTARRPDPVFVHGLPFAPPERAALDAARRQHEPERLRELLTLPIYYGMCTPEQLRAELDAGNQRGTAAVRQQLRFIAQTRDNYVHGLARQLLNRSPLPPPRWEATVYDRAGRSIGAVDAWWDEIGMGWQFRKPTDGSEREQAGRLSLTAAGVVVVRSSPESLRTNGNAVLRELVSAFRAAATRVRPAVRCAVPGQAA